MLGVVKINKTTVYIKNWYFSWHVPEADIWANQFCHSDDGFWNMLAEISIFNVNSCFVCLL